jgi:uncharacterized membrane protein
MTIITHNKSTNIYSKKTMAMLHASNWPDFNTTNLLASGAVALIPTLIALGTSIHHNERTISISFQSTKWHLAIALIVPAIFLGLWLPHALRSIDWNTSQSIVTNLEIIRERYEKNLPLTRSLAF